MQNMKYKNLLKYYKLIFFFVILTYLIFKAEYNFGQIYEKINTGFFNIIIIIIFHIIFFNLISLRMFLVLKLGLKKFLPYFNWTKIYFESLALNIVLSHAGTVYRAYVLKKNNIKYRSYISFFYVLFFSYIILNFFFILAELIILIDGDTFLKLYCLIVLILIILIFLILPNFVLYLIDLIKRFFPKNNYQKIIFVINEIISKIKKLIIDKNILIILFIFGLICHVLELGLFYFSFNIFLGETTMSKIIILFGISFVLDRIPIIRNIPGFSEIIFATVLIPFGFEFTYSLLTKFLLRFSGIISIGFNYILCLIIRDFLYYKNNL